MRLWGPSDGTGAPSGAAKIAKGRTEAFSDDIRIRQADEHITPAATRERGTRLPRGPSSMGLYRALLYGDVSNDPGLEPSPQRPRAGVI